MATISPAPAWSALRSQRKRAGLTQRDLARVLGTAAYYQISRHERSLDLPHFLAAVGYEVIFRTSVSELFPGVYDALRDDIEVRLAAFEAELQQQSVKGREATLIARKLEWLCTRRNGDDKN